MGRFDHKIVAVIGAGAIGPGWGNGKAAAALYAREGAQVIAADINLEAAQETQKIIQHEGGACQAMAIDVTSEDSVAGFFSSLESDYGRLDVLHNNVGTAFMKATDALSLEEWRRGIDINLTSAFLTCRSAVPLMKANKGGAIINTSSIADRRWLDVPFAPYASAKAGIVQFTQTLALEYAPFGIRANVIVPGFMDTPTIVASYNDVVSGEIEAMKARRNAAVPLGHMGDAWDIARAAAFLASDDARYITGIDLVVDGGLTCSVGFKV